jgi:hypothetical protein
MKRKIRLTESEFHSLVKRLVMETKHHMEEEDDDKDDDKMSKEDAIEKIADFFKKDVFPKVRKKEPEL